MNPAFLKSALCLCALALVACGGTQAAPAQPRPFTIETLGRFEEPWAMSFLPDGALLVTEKRGRLKLRTPEGTTLEVSGVPEVAYGGQGGLGDVLVHPDHARNRVVYLSYAEAGEDGTRGAAVARATLRRDRDSAALEGLEVVWRQSPKVSGQGHYGHRLLVRDGFLWISSGDRQKFDPAQDMDSTMGKIVRLREDGSVPADNPFADRDGVGAQVWSLGHRNPLGMAFAADGTLYAIEMGPAGGDELNRIQRGANYGYPIVSDGDHYDGRLIPDHRTRPEFAAPLITWTPVISPSSLIVYDGDAFPDWRGDLFASGLSSEALVRIELDGARAREAERFDLEERVRCVRQAPDGTLWLLMDGSDGRLLRLAPRRAGDEVQTKAPGETR